jgi:dTMP kinase
MINEYLQGKTHLDAHVIHLLFAANRWESMDALSAQLASGTTVIVDRYAYSGLAYSVAKGLPWEWCEGADRGLLLPDLVVYMHLEPEVAASRGDYGEERYEQVDFQAKLAEHFKRMSFSSACPWVVGRVFRGILPW